MGKSNSLADDKNVSSDAPANNLPNFFLAGCQKTASTWLHQCFREHPDVFVPTEDATHYFTINYYRGIEWYRSLYKEWSGQQLVGDTTPSYIRDNQAPRRIAEFNADAKIIFTLRNPIDRAFSHYWHEKKKKKIAFEFSEGLQNYDLYQNWIVAGFYYQHIQRFYKYFGQDQILIMIFDDLKSDSQKFLETIFEFLGVDLNFVPSIIDKKVNVAWHHEGSLYPSGTNPGAQDLLKNLYATVIPNNLRNAIKRVRRKYAHQPKMSEYYEVGINKQIRNAMRLIFEPEIKKLEKLIGRDLSHWA